ncbi:uncharacterized protein LOC135467470 [Liolophura sinensis]|uniref:uncharacterized protein LOC135467470 n=1 Tax=Liolophura sinensis TaxID=3198878 RepID=UPI0031583665
MRISSVGLLQQMYSSYAGERLNADSGARDDPVKTTFSLIEANTKEDRSECVFAQTNLEDNTISYHITIPAKGFWKFQIFALPQSDPSKSLAGVYNYLIHCVKVTKRAYPRPTQFKDWKDGCILKEPMVLHGDVSGPTVRFRVTIPDANKVAVVVEQQWTHLMKIDDEWSGNVVLRNHYGKNASVTLNALYGPEGGSYSTLLEYTI